MSGSRGDRIVRFDERSRLPKMRGVSSDDLIRRIQRAYPQIWYHCHTKHTGRRDELSDRESIVLSHLGGQESRAPGPLAQHLGIGASTLSEAIDKLAQRGYVERCPDPSDRRRVRYRITDEGSEAIDRSSVLSSTRLREVVQRLAPGERERAVAGMELIAQACRPAEDDARGSR